MVVFCAPLSVGTTIRDVSKMSSGEQGIVPVLHSHAGNDIEVEDEVRCAFEKLSSELVKLCIDTGHLAYEGNGSLPLDSKPKDRLTFKDVDERKLDRPRSEGIDFFKAVAEGVFCLPGEGMVDFKGVRQVLEKIDCQGWAVIEPNCDPSVGPNPLRDADTNLQFVRKTGLIT